MTIARHSAIAALLISVCWGCSQSSNSDQIVTTSTESAEAPLRSSSAQIEVEHSTGTSPLSHGDYGDNTALDGAYESNDKSDRFDTYSEELERQRIAEAKQAVVDAQYDLNRSVRSLSNGDWENDLPTVQRRLRALEDANSSLDSLDSTAAADMGWEISRMKREMRRLEDENWRDVVPDIERRNRSIGRESDNLESSIDE